MLTFPLSRLLSTILFGLALALPVHMAAAASENDFLASLGPAQQQEFTTWKAAQVRIERRLDAYWDAVERKRKGRRPKRSSGKLYQTEDYVWTFPPEYKGPQLSPDLKRRYSRYLAAKEKAQPKSARRSEPRIDDFLAAAKKYYGFEPTRISEREFKRRYAEEALALGLTKEQVVRVYALETGGNGTADMQAATPHQEGPARSPRRSATPSCCTPIRSASW